MRRLVGSFFALALVFGAVGCGGNNKDLIIGKWNSTDDKDKHSLEFGKDGKLIWSNEKGNAEGKYTWVDEKTIEMEYELPEAVYQMQKAVFDEAKKAFDSVPDNPLKGSFGQVEPVKKVKDKATVEIKDGVLTLKGGKTVQYKKG